MRTDKIAAIIDRQRHYFNSGATLPVENRIAALKKLRKALIDHEEEIAKAREAYLAANPAGAETAFNEYVDDIVNQRVTVILTKDMQGVLEIFASQEENFRDATPEMLSTLGKPIESSLAERFGTALLLSANGTETLSGHEHAWLGYWLRAEELNLQMDILAAVLPDAWLYEVDIITAGGNQELRAMLYMFAAQTLHYTPLTNALD